MGRRLHVVGLPHSEASAAFSADAYMGKHRRFVPMMMSLGYEVFSYAGEHSDMDATEHVVVSSDEDKRRWFGSFDHHKDFFPITWGPGESHWVESNNNAIREIGERILPGDVVCLIAGVCQQQIALAFPDNPVVEYGIGYTGTFADFRVFESYTHMHYCYGLANDDNGRFYDAVVPNFFDPNEFYLSDKEDYFVFLGRFIPRKGPEVAVEATRRMGARLIMAGQGATQRGDTVYANDGSMSLSGAHISHIGHVDVQQRAELLSKARGVFMPTTYLEPFGGVSIEALLSGTPVIASDFGVFSETIPHGVAGFRFRTVGEAVAGALRVGELDPVMVRQYAVDNFSVDRVKLLYDDYFDQVGTLFMSPVHSDGFRRDGFYSDWFGRRDRYAKVGLCG